MRLLKFTVEERGQILGVLNALRRPWPIRPPARTDAAKQFAADPGLGTGHQKRLAGHEQ
jgi:hypothetical protein